MSADELVPQHPPITTEPRIFPNVLSMKIKKECASLTGVGYGGLHFKAKDVFRKHLNFAVAFRKHDAPTTLALCFSRFHSH
jgi:hypothetical protein